MLGIDLLRSFVPRLISGIHSHNSSKVDGML